jgi:hypothetical protein
LLNPFGKCSIFNEVMGLSFFVKLNLSLDEFVEGSDSSKFLFKKRAGNHLEVDFHFDELAPIFYFCFNGGLFTDLSNLAD